MRAAVMREVNKPLTIENVDVSKPGPHEVLLRTAAAGVCHSDLHHLDGTLPSRLPVILGHESSAIVEQVGSQVSYVKPGDHVIATYTGFCGHCNPCISGTLVRCQGTRELRRSREEAPRLSQNGKNVQQFGNLSSFAEQMLMHEHNVVKINPAMPLDRAALIGCAVTAGVGAVFHSAAVKPGQSVVVIGCGGIGLAAVNGAAIAGATRIIAIDRHDSKLELAKSCGATDIVRVGQEDSVDFVRDMTKGGVDHAFEAIGLKSTIEQAYAMLAPGGTATILGVPPPTLNIEIPSGDFLLEKKIQGSYMGSCRPRVDMPVFVDMYLQGRLHLDLLISERIPLEDINQAFEGLKSGKNARSVIVFDD